MRATHIRAVDATDNRMRALLEYLQLATLRNTYVFDVSEGYWWVAFDGSLPVAFGGLAQSSQWSDAAYLCRSGVLPSHRGHGLQKRLVRVRERKAKVMGMKWLITDTYKNPASANSLIGCGYKTFSPSKPWSFDGAIYWRKKIA